MAKKRKYIRKKPIDSFTEEEIIAPDPLPEVAIEPEPEVLTEEPIPNPGPENVAVRCECGDFANPGSNQCWRCSHRT